MKARTAAPETLEEYADRKAWFIAANITNGRDAERIHEIFKKRFIECDLRTDDPSQPQYRTKGSNGGKKIHHVKGRISEGDEIRKFATANPFKEITPLLPKGLVGKGEKISEELFWKIYREVTMMALMNQAPYVSLDADPRTDYTLVNTELPPLLRKTLVGEILIKSDYAMKVITHYPVAFIQDDDKMSELVDFFRKNRVHKGADFLEGEEHIRNIRRVYLSFGAKILGDQPEKYKDVLSLAKACDYESLKEAEEKKARGEEQSVNVSGGRRIYPTEPKVFFNPTRGEISCTSRYKAATFHTRKTPGGGGEDIIDEECASTKWLNYVFRQEKFPPVKSHMAAVDLIFMLYPIVRTMIEQGYKPDFSKAPDYNGRGHTPWQLPPVLVVQSDKYGKFVRAYGGINYGLNGGDRLNPITTTTTREQVGGSPLSSGTAPITAVIGENMARVSALKQQIPGAQTYPGLPGSSSAPAYKPTAASSSDLRWLQYTTATPAQRAAEDLRKTLGYNPLELEDNRSWVRDLMAQGATIHDAGPSFLDRRKEKKAAEERERRGEEKGPTFKPSAYYQMERQETKDYTEMCKRFERAGQLGGSSASTHDSDKEYERFKELMEQRGAEKQLRSVSELRRLLEEGRTAAPISAAQQKRLLEEARKR